MYLLSIEELHKMKTRQLLAHLRTTYLLEYYYPSSDIVAYQNQIKTILATREHIPNKIESKMLRKARIKRGV